MKKIITLFLMLVVFPLYANESIAPTNVLIAAVQFPELNHQSETDFFSMVDNYINEAQKKQVKIILFPELLTLNLMQNSDNPTPEQWSTLSKFSNKYSDFLKSRARSSGMFIIGGSTVTEKNHQFYNTAMVAFPNGEIKTVDKSLLTPWELSNHITGVGQQTHPLSFITPWGTAVVLICYEAESPEILSKISQIHPNLVFIPSNTSGLSGLYRVIVAARYIAISQYAYALLTGVTTNFSKDKVSGHSAGQAIFAAPTGLGYSLTGTLGKFNQPDLLIVKVNIEKMDQDKASPAVTSASRDYVKQHALTSR